MSDSQKRPRKAAPQPGSFRQANNTLPRRAAPVRRPILSNANAKRYWGTARETSILVGAPLRNTPASLNTNSRGRIAYQQAWATAVSIPIATATQLAALSGGTLEVDAISEAASRAGWRVVDADRGIEATAKTILNPVAGNKRAPVLITKPKFSLTPLKKFAYGVYPPFGPPFQDTDGTWTAPLHGPVNNNIQYNSRGLPIARWAGNAPLGLRAAVLQNTSWHKSILLRIAGILRELEGGNAWSKVISMNNLILPKKGRGNTGNKSAGKGSGSMETDACIKEEEKIEVAWFGQRKMATVEKALEFKATRGHHNTVAIPTEDLQLKKHVMTVLLLWYTNQLTTKGPAMATWDPPPVMRLYFVAWFFGIPRTRESQPGDYVGMEFTPASVDIANELRALLPLFGISDKAYDDMFIVQPVTPINFQEITGLNPAIVSQVMAQNRRGGVIKMGKISKSESLRGWGYMNQPEALMRFNAGALPANFLNTTEVKFRQEGQWGKWLEYITNGSGWASLQAHPSYWRIAAEILNDYVIKNLLKLSQYYGANFLQPLPTLPLLHGRNAPKGKTDQSLKFLEAFDILVYFKNIAPGEAIPALSPALAANPSPFLQIFRILEAWGRANITNNPALRLDWSKVPGRAKTLIRKNATELPVALSIGLPATTNANYNKNARNILSKFRSELNARPNQNNPGAVMAQLYKGFIGDHAPNSVKNGIKKSLSQTVESSFINRPNVVPAIKSIVGGLAASNHPVQKRKAR